MTYLVTLGAPVERFADLIKSYFQTSKSIASNIDVTNQSLLAGLNRFRDNPEVLGRYFPSEFSATPIRRISPFSYTRVHTENLLQVSDSSMLINSILAISILAIAWKFILPLYFQNYQKFSTKTIYLLLAFPIVSPLFWYVHLVYIFPVFLLLANACIGRYSVIFVVTSGILIFATNWRIFGGAFVDIALYSNLITYSCLALIAACVLLEHSILKTVKK